MSLLSWLAASAPVPILVVAGVGARAAAWALAADRRLEVVASPRHASLLCVVGALPVDHRPALQRLHDQLAHPRAALWWSGQPLGEAATAALPGVVEVAEDPAAVAVRLHRRLMTGDRGTSPVLGPTESPTEWRGVGPHGQGGEGMMGGTPYGRPMAMTGEDVRDGLALDRVAVTLGPHHAALPAGLTLELELQGDVIVSCGARLAEGPWWGRTPTGPEGDATLLWLAELLRVHGLGAVAVRVARCALGGAGDRDRVVAAARRRLAPALRGVGTIEGRDALARLDARLAGAEPQPTDGPVTVLESHLPGLEWGRAVTTVWSLDPTGATRRVAAGS